LGLRNFKDLVVWRKAHALTLALYLITRSFPKDELYGIVSQIRRRRGIHRREPRRRLWPPRGWRIRAIRRDAMGSASDLAYHLLLARDLGFLKEPDFDRLDNELAEVRRMLTTLLLKVKPPAEVAKS
jgi:hypothetical protein